MGSDISSNSLKAGAWSIIVGLSLISIFASLEFAVVFMGIDSLIIIFGALAVISSLPWFYGLIVFRNLLHHRLDWKVGGAYVMSIFWIFVASILISPLIFMSGLASVIGWILMVILQILEGIPILLLSLAIYREKMDLWGLGQLFGIFGLVTAISIFTVIGFLTFGSLTYLGWFIIMVIVMFRAAKEIETGSEGSKIVQ